MSEDSGNIENTGIPGDAGNIAHFEREADEFDDVQLEIDADLDLEAPEADAAEQRTEVLQHADQPIAERPADQVEEADPADVADQLRIVDLDDEDYR